MHMQQFVKKEKDTLEGYVCATSFSIQTIWSTDLNFETLRKRTDIEGITSVIMEICRLDSKEWLAEVAYFPKQMPLNLSAPEYSKERDY